MQTTNNLTVQDAMMARALVQGALHGLVHRYIYEREGAGVAIVGIDQEKDDVGNYLPYFSITMESGTVLKVSVDVSA